MTYYNSFNGKISINIKMDKPIIINNFFKTFVYCPVVHTTINQSVRTDEENTQQENNVSSTNKLSTTPNQTIRRTSQYSPINVSSTSHSQQRRSNAIQSQSIIQSEPGVSSQSSQTLRQNKKRKSKTILHRNMKKSKPNTTAENSPLSNTSTTDAQNGNSLESTECELISPAASSTQTDSAEINRQNFYEIVNGQKGQMMNLLIEKIGQPYESKIEKLSRKNGKEPDCIMFRWLQCLKYHNVEKKVILMDNGNAGESNLRIEYSTGEKLELEIQSIKKMQNCLILVGLLSGEQLIDKLKKENSAII